MIQRAMVYVAINSRTGDCYVGATNKGLERRKSVHLYNARSGRVGGHFYAAIRKYGEGAFDFYKVADCRDFSEALEHERALITVLKPKYNMTRGGGGTLGWFPSEEIREKMRLAKIGKKITDPIRLERMRANCRKQVALRRRKMVRCITEDRVFESVTAASKHYGISDGTVINCCKNRYDSPRVGLKFEYVVGA